MVKLFQLPTFAHAVFSVFKMLLSKKMSERYLTVGSDETETGWITGSETCWTTVWSKVERIQ